jgi:hypothetical protein
LFSELLLLRSDQARSYRDEGNDRQETASDTAEDDALSTALRPILNEIVSRGSLADPMRK